MSATPAIAPRAPRSFDDVVNQLRELIYRGDVRVGERLPAERALAEQFQVSRNMVREGLRTLEAAGLIELRQGRSGGAFVRGGGPEIVTRGLRDMLRLGGFTLDDLAEARLWLSTTIVRVVAERVSERDLHRLEENVAQSVSFARRRHWSRLAQTNMAFLDLLAASTRNPVLEAIHESVMGVLRQISAALGPIRSDETVRHRERIIAFVRAGDADGAVAEMIANLDAVHAYWRRELAGRGTLEDVLARAQRNATG